MYLVILVSVIRGFVSSGIAFVPYQKNSTAVRKRRIEGEQH